MAVLHKGWEVQGEGGGALVEEAAHLRVIKLQILQIDIKSLIRYHNNRSDTKL